MQKVTFSQFIILVLIVFLFLSVAVRSWLYHCCCSFLPPGLGSAPGKIFNITILQDMLSYERITYLNM